MDKKVIVSIIVVLVLLVGVFLIFGNKNKVKISDEDPEPLGPDFGDDAVPVDWRDFEIKDVLTGETYIISDITKPILLESFAVWCPTCTKQQKITKVFHEEVGDSVVSISIDTDPNEDENRVKEHIERNGFNWYYAVAPVEMTRSLIDQFGIGIVNAPAVPMILICGNNDVKKLSSGIKSVSELKEEVANCKI